MCNITLNIAMLAAIISSTSTSTPNPNRHTCRPQRTRNDLKKGRKYWRSTETLLRGVGAGKARALASLAAFGCGAFEFGCSTSAASNTGFSVSGQGLGFRS